MAAVLFVDDEPFILDAYKRMLRNSDIQCHTLVNSQEVEWFLCQNTIDIVVADQQMPVLSGSDLLADLKKRFPKIKRVLISGNLNLLEQTTTDGLDALLEKPCSRAMMLACLQSLIKPT